MCGTASVKGLGALALIALLLVPASAGAAEKEKQSPRQWVWGEWSDGNGQERRQQREAERDKRREREQDRRSAEKQKRLADQRERLARKRERLAEEREQLAGKRERLAAKRERLAAERERKAERPRSGRYEDRRRTYRHDRGSRRYGGNRYGRNRYGLVYGSPRDRPHHRYHRPHHGYHRPHDGYRPPRPHPCGPWLYDGRAYDPVAHWDDDDFWHWDGRWSPCGPRRSRVRRSTYVVHMTGAQVDPAGPPDASGVANLLLLRDGSGTRGRICHRLSLRGTDTDAPLEAHLHEGRPGRNGPEVFDLDLARNGRQGCRNADAWLVRRIARSPGSFYLDVHTRTHGTGVVRGQPARAYRG